MLHLVAAQKWIPKLAGALHAIRKKRKTTLRQIGDTFGDPLRLARYYIQPLCQHNNPATEDSDIDSIIRETAFATLDAFFARCDTEVHSDGRRQMFVLADAGMGKTSLLMMLKLAHLCSFWPSEYKCELLKLGTDTAAEIAKLADHAHTVLLLDSLDEDPAAFGRIHDRIGELLALTNTFCAVVITCRTQYFPITESDPLERLGSVRVAGYRCPIIYLSPFTDDQVNQYLRKRFPRSFWRWLRRKDSPRHTAAQRVLKKTKTLHLRPMLLAYIDDLARKDSEDELNAYQAFEILVQEWLEREVRRGKVESKKALYDACVAVARRLDKLEQRALSREELAEVYIEEPRAQNVELIDVGGRALLNMTSAGAFRFAHFSLQEFVLAKEIVQRSVASFKNGLDASQLFSIRCTAELINFVREGLLAQSQDRVTLYRDEQSLEVHTQKLTISRVEFRDINFATIHISDLQFIECSFPGASYAHADLGGCSFIMCDMRQADLSHSKLVKTQLEKAKLAGANLGGANLGGADLGGANLAGAKLAEAKLAEAKLAVANLAGAFLVGAKLAVANLAGAYLAGTKLAGVYLAEANLAGAYLAGVYLAEAQLAEAKLAEAKLARAKLARANLAGAKLARAKLARAKLAGANLARANLAGADFGEADLGETYFAEAYFAEAYFAGADLAGANLAGANLAGANLAGANLAGANLAGADLAGADLAGANLAEANLDTATFDRANYNEHTRWPNGFAPAAVGCCFSTREK